MNVRGLFLFVVGTATIFGAMALLGDPLGIAEPPASERQWVSRAIGGVLFFGVFTVAGILCIRKRKPTVQSTRESPCGDFPRKQT
jgi:hypothetical protein